MRLAYPNFRKPIIIVTFTADGIKVWKKSRKKLPLLWASVAMVTAFSQYWFPPLE